MNNKVITGRACGKFILLGEHFIVTASTPALAFPLPELFCEVKLEEAGVSSFEAQSDGVVVRENQVRLKMEEALKTALRFMKREGFAFKLESSTNIPIQKGFGSSAAFSVALSRAVTTYFKEDLGILGNSIDTIEGLFHKTPSGVDTTTILHQKPIRFEKGVGAQEIFNQACDFILLDSGDRKNCAEQIAIVSKIRENDKKLWERLASQMRDVIETVQHALHQGDTEEVAYGVREAQDILASLQLSNEKTYFYIKESMSEGVLAGKVSGAGGGGAVVLVTRAHEGDAVALKLKQKNIPVVAVAYAM